MASESANLRAPSGTGEADGEAGPPCRRLPPSRGGASGRAGRGWCRVIARAAGAPGPGRPAAHGILLSGYGCAIFPGRTRTWGQARPGGRGRGHRSAAAAACARRPRAGLADRPDPDPPGARRAGRRHRDAGRRHDRAAPGGGAAARPRDRARQLAQHPAARGGRRAAPGRDLVRAALRRRVADRPGPGPGGRAVHRDPPVPGRRSTAPGAALLPRRRGIWPGWRRSAGTARSPGWSGTGRGTCWPRPRPCSSGCLPGRTNRPCCCPSWPRR